MLFTVYALEEISWGQRIIGWETPPDFAVMNYQGETNLHNLFNPYIDYAYGLFASLIAAGLWLLPNIKKKWFGSRHLQGLEYLLPHRTLALFSVPYLMLAFIFMLGFEANELFEEVFAVTGITYAFTSPKFSINKVEHNRSLSDSP